MSLSADRIIFNIHSICPVNRTTGLPYGILKVLGDASLTLSAESVDLYGGSNKFPWASEVTQIQSQFTANVRALPDFLFELYAGGSASTTAASATGTCGTLTNKVGTSVMNGTTGIASATLKSGETSELKAGRFIVKAVSATTVDVYAVTDLDFTDGTDVSFQNDALKITASPLTITASTAVEVPNTGIELTGGSGTIGMTEDDVAYYDVAPAHGGISDITLGQSGITFPEHELFIYAAERSDGSKFEIHAYKATSSAGIVIPLSQGGFGITDLTAKLLYDSTAGKVADIRAIAGT